MVGQNGYAMVHSVTLIGGRKNRCSTCHDQYCIGFCYKNKICLFSNIICAVFIIIVAYDANKAVNYSDCYALTENSLFYVADKDCTNFVSQCVWAGYGGWVNGDETANAQNIAAHYRMYHHNNSDWYTTSWFAHKNGGSSPWESATSHGNFALGNTGSGLGPFGLGSTTAVLYSNYDASSIQRGDVVQLGRSANDIRHSVIVRTAGSSFENIFVNSHNSKHYNYPLSKYFETYSYIRVIHYRPAFFAN